MNYIFTYPGTVFIYALLVFFVTGLAILINTERYSHRVKILFLSVIIITLALLAGLRDKTVGIDTMNYWKHFNNWKAGEGGGIVFEYEPGLYLLAKLILLISGNVQLVFIVVSFVVNFLIVKRLWQLKESISFPFAVFTYSAIFYIMTFSGLRQWLAISIVFYATAYLFKKEYISFFLFVIIGAIFHNSALLALLYLPLDLIFRDMSDAKQNKQFKTIIIISPLIILLIVLFVFNKSEILVKYLYLFNEEYRRFDIGFAFLVKLFMVFLAIALIKNIDDEFYNSEYFKKIILFYSFGLLLSFPGYFYKNLTRISWYFMIYETVFFGIIVNTKEVGSVGNIFKFLTFIIISYTFFVELNGSSYGHVPYIPFWK